MIAMLQLILVVMTLGSLTGCRGRDPVIAMAESEFGRQHPEIEILETGIRKRETDRVLVYIRFVHTPATAIPSKAGVWERNLLYASKDGRWQCIESRGDNWIRPMR